MHPETSMLKRIVPRTTWGFVWRALLLAIIVLSVDAFWFEPSSIRVVEHSVELGTRADPLHGLRIAVIADLHAGAPYIDESKVRQVVKLALAARPDLVLLAGDYVGEDLLGRREISIATIASLLKPLRARLGVFAVLGNHDHWAGAEQVADTLRGAGIRVLQNESVQLVIPGVIYLVGIDDAVTGHADVPLAFRRVPNNAVALCLTHSPDVFPDLPQACRLTITGHTHGGQVNLPFVGRLIVPSKFGQRYASGDVRENGKVLFVSTGIGTSILPVRFRVPPEISVIEIR
jgi:hypothetical protein